METERRFSIVAWLICAAALAALLCLGFAGCNEEICKPTAWVMTGPDLGQLEQNRVVGRVGIENTDGIEFGFETEYLGYKGLNQSYGAYFTQDFQVLVQPAFGTQYIGARAGVIDVSDGSSYGVIGGWKYPLTKNISTVIEGQWLNYDDALEAINGADKEWKILGGLKVKF